MAFYLISYLIGLARLKYKVFALIFNHSYSTHRLLPFKPNLAYFTDLSKAHTIYMESFLPNLHYLKPHTLHRHVHPG